jgi:tRNA (mo5U34)-methyltransferase
MSRTYGELFRALAADPALADWGRSLERQVEAALAPDAHGDMPRWRAALEALPEICPSSIDLNAPALRIGAAADCDDETRQRLTEALMAFHPWRKGPFEIFGIPLDTEWRSDWKWERVSPHLSPLAGRRVLDVGCGNGYYAWRMAGAGAELVVGLDPTLVFVMQHQALRRYIGPSAAHVLPLGIEAVPEGLRAFDTVFSMGVLYHRRSPFDHLMQLRDTLRPGGELVLETLVVDGPEGHTLVPEGRYAKMRNVWFLPSVPTLESWLRRCRFRNIRVVDVARTTVEEQRSTAWMRFESLPDYLEPQRPDRTVEGLPAPVRAVIIAETAQ